MKNSSALKTSMFNDEELGKAEAALVAKAERDIVQGVISDVTTEDQQQAIDNVVKNAPPALFIKTHPFGKFQYIPIAILEPLAQALDSTTHSELLREGSIANGFYCVVRLYFNGRTYDGIGAAEFQTAKGAAPTDFTKLNSNAVVMGVPKARSEALKNAYAQIGDLFGRGLRRPGNISMEKMENSKLVRASKVDNKLAKLKEIAG